MEKVGKGDGSLFQTANFEKKQTMEKVGKENRPLFQTLQMK